MRICYVGSRANPRQGLGPEIRSPLKQLGPTTECYAEVVPADVDNEHVVNTILDNQFDCYIFHGTEILASQLLPAGLQRTIIIPTCDEAGYQSEQFWARFVDCRFIALSRLIHERLQRIGSPSSYFQYFPEMKSFDLERDEPERFVAELTFSGSRGELEADLPWISRLCRAIGVDRLQVWTSAIDDYDLDQWNGVTIGGVTLAADAAGPQGSPAQGSGGALFQFISRTSDAAREVAVSALTRGQIVVAPDLAPINEYVAHLVSGFLFDPARVDEPRSSWSLDRSLVIQMRAAAQRKAVEGRRTWLQDVDRLVSIITDDGRRWSTTDYSAHFGQTIRQAAHERGRRA